MREIGKQALVAIVLGTAGTLALALVRPLPLGPRSHEALAVLAAAIALWGGWRLHARLREETARVRFAEEGRRFAEGEARSQRETIDAFADGLDVAVFILGERASVAYANRRAREMFGAPRAVGKSLLAITLSPELEAMVHRASTGEGPQSGEIAVQPPGDRIALAKAWRPFEAGPTFASLVEITDLRRLERIRKDFVANVSHELRTPLTIIRAYAETLQEDDDPDLRARYLSRVVNEVDRLAAMGGDLLVLATAESGGVPLQECDLAEIVRGIVLGPSPRADEKGLEIRYDGPEHLMIAANESQMVQVALNLVENAVKYSQRGGVRVTLAGEGPHAVLRVQDAGIGIASEHIERIFERFYRVDKGRTRTPGEGGGNVGGTGLGLAIVRHIVEAHGGSVAVESALNVGSTFTVTLPIVPPHGEPPYGEPPAPTPGDAFRPPEGAARFSAAAEGG